MKTIKIEKITLENFKNHKSLELEFDGKDAALYGDNATGKTSVYDALLWLLFGKDSRGQGEKNMDVKPLDADGNVRDHQAVTCVEAVLRVEDAEDGGQVARATEENGRHSAVPTVTLRKSMRESWVQRRGSSEAVYDGNLFEYAVDGVPMKKNEFVARVKDLVDEEVFGLLTSVTAFAEDLDWRKRRAILYDLTGLAGMSDRELMMKTGEFDELAAIMGSKPLEDVKKMLQHQKRNLSAVREQTPARISEMEKQENALAALDFSAAEAALQNAEQMAKRLRNELAEREAQAKDPDQGRRLAELGAKRQELEAWKTAELAKLDAAQAEIREQIRALSAENQDYRRKQLQAIPNDTTLRETLAALEARAARLRSGAEDRKKEAASLDVLVDEDRAKWLEISKETFTGGTCPTCGQTLPMEMLEQARSRFEQDKAGRLERIQITAQGNLERAKKLRDTAEEIERELLELKPQCAEAREAVEKAQDATQNVRDMDGYRARMDALAAKLSADSSGSILSEYGQRKKLLDEQENEILLDGTKAKTALEASLEGLRRELSDSEAEATRQRGVLAQRSSLEYVRNRSDELRGEQQAAARELEQIEGVLWQAEKFVRWKAKSIEDNVNGLFSAVTFRLFREQANGGLEERCDVVVNGVPWASLNNGARINAGVDVIRRLAEHYGVRVPLFVDNAESVTRLADAGTQVVRLVVSENDKVLRMEKTAG